MPTCVAPPASRALRVANPSWILRTSVLLAVVGLGTRHTLASYLSTQSVPATTASGAHCRTGVVGGIAKAARAMAIDSPSARQVLAVVRFIVFLSVMIPG